MKRFVESVLEWKTAASFVFSGSVLLCMVVFWIQGAPAVPIATLLSLLVVSSAGTALQFIAFTDRVFKRMRYTVRMVVFAVPFFALLLGSAYVFRWFPVAYAMHWWLFAGIFLLVFAGSTISFEIYFHKTEKKYDGLLGQYRKQRDAEQ